jgi:hypothetical protein
MSVTTIQKSPMKWSNTSSAQAIPPSQSKHPEFIWKNFNRMEFKYVIRFIKDNLGKNLQRIPSNRICHCTNSIDFTFHNKSFFFVQENNLLWSLYVMPRALQNDSDVREEMDFEKGLYDPAKTSDFSGWIRDDPAKTSDFSGWIRDDVCLLSNISTYDLLHILSSNPDNNFVFKKIDIEVFKQKFFMQASRDLITSLMEIGYTVAANPLKQAVFCTINGSQIVVSLYTDMWVFINGETKSILSHWDLSKEALKNLQVFSQQIKTMIC